MPFVETRSSWHIVCFSSDPPTARPGDKPTTKMAEYVYIISVDDWRLNIARRVTTATEQDTHEKLIDLVAHARRAFRLKQYEQAVELYGQALES